METLGVLDHLHQKSYYQFVGNFRAYLHAKINFITHFFLTILQKTANLLCLTWSCLATHTQNDSTNLKKPLMFICKKKNQLHSLSFPWDIAKILQTCYFGYFDDAWLHTPKVLLSTCKELSRLSTSKKSSSSHVFLEILQGYTNLFWVLLACLPMIASTCRTLPCLWACQKYPSWFTFFLRYYVLKNPAIW